MLFWYHFDKGCKKSQETYPRIINSSRKCILYIDCLMRFRILQKRDEKPDQFENPVSLILSTVLSSWQKHAFDQSHSWKQHWRLFIKSGVTEFIHYGVDMFLLEKYWSWIFYRPTVYPIVDDMIWFILFICLWIPIYSVTYLNW